MSVLIRGGRGGPVKGFIKPNRLRMRIQGMRLRIVLFLLAAVPVVLLLSACGGKGGGGGGY